MPQDGRARADDAAVLARAIELGRVVLTKNRHDFHRLHAAAPDPAASSPSRTTQTALPSPTEFQAAVSAHADLAGVLIRIVKPNPPPKAP